MNKLAVVLSVAVVATLSGCKDPDFKRPGASNQSDVHMADTQPAPPPADTGVNKPEVKDSPAPTPPVIAKKGCLCAPGTIHAEPCKCGADDCACIVKTKSAKVPASEQEYSTYVVQNGDYLAKISKKCNVTIAAIKKANDLKSDTIRIGQKLKIPGKLPESMTAAPAAAEAPKAAAAAKKSYTPYTGATKEYVVKNGDTLGAIAYGNGINIRQLKELNGLSSDVLRIGQKLKIPADGKAAAKTTVAEAKSAEAAEKPAADVPASADADAAAAAPVAADEAKVEQAAASAEQAAAAAPGTTTYVVQEGEDMTTMAIRFGVAAGVIRELNNLPDDAQLKPGQVIKLPADVQQ